jgi:biotin transporter BioY
MEDSTAIVLQGTWIIAFLLAAFVIGWFIGRDISLQPT